MFGISIMVEHITCVFFVVGINVCVSFPKLTEWISATQMILLSTYQLDEKSDLKF